MSKYTRKLAQLRYQSYYFLLMHLNNESDLICEFQLRKMVILPTQRIPQCREEGDHGVRREITCKLGAGRWTLGGVFSWFGSSLGILVMNRAALLLCCGSLFCELCK